MTGRVTVDILTGFLGSGKTTLLNRLLAARGFENVAVVVNELGEVGLDHLLVERREDQIALLEGGCLCCAVVDSLPETLLDLCRRRAGGELPAFDRIVIETTGLADPAPIAEVIRRSPLLGHFLAPGVIVTAFDTVAGGGTAGGHPEAMAQLVMADRVVLTKLDLPGASDEAARATVATLNPLAESLTAEAIVAAPARLVAAAPIGRAVSAPSAPSAQGRHSHGIVAHHLPVAEPATRAGLAAFAVVAAHRLGPALLRCKGVVIVAGRPMLVQGVGARFTFEEAPAAARDAASGLTCIVQDRPRDEVAALLPWLTVPEGTQPPAPEDL